MLFTQSLLVAFPQGFLEHFFFVILLVREALAIYHVVAAVVEDRSVSYLV